MKEAPNYLVITLVFLLLGVHAYFSNKNDKLNNEILILKDTINQQNTIINIYQLYLQEKNPQTIKPFYFNDNKNTNQPI